MRKSSSFATVLSLIVCGAISMLIVMWTSQLSVVEDLWFYRNKSIKQEDIALSVLEYGTAFATTYFDVIHKALTTQTLPLRFDITGTMQCVITQLPRDVEFFLEYTKIKKIPENAFFLSVLIILVRRSFLSEVGSPHRSRATCTITRFVTTKGPHYVRHGYHFSAQL